MISNNDAHGGRFSGSCREFHESTWMISMGAYGAPERLSQNCYCKKNESVLLCVLCSMVWFPRDASDPACIPGRVLLRSSSPKPVDKPVFFSFVRSYASDELRGQEPHMSGLRDGLCVHGGRTGILRAEALH